MGVGMQQISLDALLDWAYRAECVDKRITQTKPTGPRGFTSSNLSQYIELGTQIDNSSFAARNAAALPPDDALAVHDAVLGLACQYIEWLDNDNIKFWDESCVGFDDVKSKLTQVDVGLLIILSAKSGVAPEYYADWGKPVGRMAQDASEFDNRGRKRKTHGAVSVGEVIFARSQYIAWRGGLNVLWDALAGRLNKYEITGVCADAAPWHKKQKKVLQSLEPVIAGYNELHNVRSDGLWHRLF
jgi:hypothetical protein